MYKVPGSRPPDRSALLKSVEYRDITQAMKRHHTKAYHKTILREFRYI